jgi:hypothetical protein
MSMSAVCVSSSVRWVKAADARSRADHVDGATALLWLDRLLMARDVQQSLLIRLVQLREVKRCRGGGLWRTLWRRVAMVILQVVMVTTSARETSLPYEGQQA